MLKHYWLARRPFAFGTSLARLMFANPFRTGQRLVTALPNLGINRAFQQFHSERREKSINGRVPTRIHRHSVLQRARHDFESSAECARSRLAVNRSHYSRRLLDGWVG